MNRLLLALPFTLLFTFGAFAKPGVVLKPKNVAPVPTPHQNRARAAADPLVSIPESMKMEQQPESCQRSHQFRRVTETGFAASGAYREVYKIKTDFTGMDAGAKSAAKNEAVEKLRIACGYVMRATGDASQVMHAFPPLDPLGKEVFDLLTEPSGNANQACRRVMSNDATETVEVEKTEILGALKKLDEAAKTAVNRMLGK